MGLPTGVSWNGTLHVRRSVYQESLSMPSSSTGSVSLWIGVPWETVIGDTVTTGSSSAPWAGHSPAPWRVNVALANQPEFARDFNCPAGSRMNPEPEDRCAVW